MLSHSIPTKKLPPKQYSHRPAANDFYGTVKHYSHAEYETLKASARKLVGKCVSYSNLMKPPANPHALNLVLGVVDNIKLTTRTWTGEPKCVLMVRLSGITNIRPWEFPSSTVDHWLSFDHSKDLHIVSDSILEELGIHDKLSDYLQTIESSVATKELRQRCSVI